MSTSIQAIRIVSAALAKRLIKIGAVIAVLIFSVLLLLLWALAYYLSEW